MLLPRAVQLLATDGAGSVGKALTLITEASAGPDHISHVMCKEGPDVYSLLGMKKNQNIQQHRRYPLNTTHTHTHTHTDMHTVRHAHTHTQRHAHSQTCAHTHTDMHTHIHKTGRHIQSHRHTRINPQTHICNYTETHRYT